MSKTNKFFTESEKVQIIDAIKAAEKNTSGEIRVHLEDTCKIKSLKRAEELFTKLGMHKTELRNGILFYLAITSKEIAIAGDAGIHAKVGQDFWDSITKKTVAHFKNGEFAIGLSAAILECGEQLKQHFPYQSNDKNELSDEISFGK